MAKEDVMCIYIYTHTYIYTHISTYTYICDIFIYVYMYTHTHTGTHNGTLLSNEKWNLSICNDMSGPRGYYAKWNKSYREKQIPYDLTYMWNLKTKTNEQT